MSFIANLLGLGGPKHPAIDVTELETRNSSGPLQLVDVRTAGEYGQGHIPGTVNLPLDQIGARMGELDKTQPVYVVCRSGARSARAQAALIGAGFDAINVTGGTMAWIGQGFATE